MEQNLLIETIIKHLTRVQLSIYRQDQTPRRSIENEHPQKKVVCGLNFPDAEGTVGKQWAKHLKKSDLSFSLPEPLIFEFCRWWKANQK